MINWHRALAKCDNVQNMANAARLYKVSKQNNNHEAPMTGCFITK